MVHHGGWEVDGRQNNKKRPKLCTPQDLRSIKRQINVLREKMGKFTSNILQGEAGVNGSNSTSWRTLHRMGYAYRRTRKKDMLTRHDKLKRFKFAKRVTRLLSHHDCWSRALWTRGISMYVDWVGFAYKSNPYLHSKTPGAREWRLKHEALEVTTKAKKEGEVQTKFLVVVRHKAGVVLCERLTSRMNGKYYTSIVWRWFCRALKVSMSPKAKLVLFDGDPLQNSKVVMVPIQQINGKFFRLRPGHLTWIQHKTLFHLARRNLNKDERNRYITTEAMEQFADWVQCTLMNFKPELIGKIIETMSKRIDYLIQNRGSRIKY